MTARSLSASKFWAWIARYGNGLIGGLIVVAGVAFLAALSFGWIDILPYHSQVAEQSDAHVATAAPNVVELTPEKLAAASLHVTTAENRLLSKTRDVPGEITYDESRRVPLNAPVEGLVLQVLVEPAREVRKGQQLAVLSCPEIGTARDLVEKRRADLALARREEQRAVDVARHVDELLVLLQQKPKLPEVDQALKERMLGEYREKIIGEYSRLLFAEHVSETSLTLEGGPLSTRLIEQRKAEREQAGARFTGACESARFNAVQDRERASAEAERAERLLSVAQQALNNLLGPWGAMEEISEPERLNELKLLAPIDGRVVERQAVQNARIDAGAPLFVIANTSQMWVSAEIHERDWKALDLTRQGDSLQVRVPALSGDVLQAKVRWIGSQVEAVKRSVPIVAELSNADARLKPGMFVWAVIPLEKPHEALVVPAGAIMRHENQPFVFVPDGDRRFRRVDVRLGIETTDQIEILDGLNAGDTVVDQGAFFLKSELLLEREE
ncbi:MAG TPA: efflux RND transporter periplasmic adaptor subunit [Pirellulaceae bacterium]|jgi:cobalt-zinc-cadmium efflux system membrane fusion protein